MGRMWHDEPEPQARSFPEPTAGQPRHPLDRPDNPTFGAEDLVEQLRALDIRAAARERDVAVGLVAANGVAARSSD